MNNSEFITFIDECIKQEMLLGPYGYKYRLDGLRNIRSDFNNILVNNSELSTLDVLKEMYNDRMQKEKIDISDTDTWLQNHTELYILERWIPNKIDKK